MLTNTGSRAFRVAGSYDAGDRLGPGKDTP